MTQRTYVVWPCSKADTSNTHHYATRHEAIGEIATRRCGMQCNCEITTKHGIPWDSVGYETGVSMINDKNN